MVLLSLLTGIILLIVAGVTIVSMLSGSMERIHIPANARISLNLLSQKYPYSSMESNISISLFHLNEQIQRIIVRSIGTARYITPVPSACLFIFPEQSIQKNITSAMVTIKITANPIIFPPCSCLSYCEVILCR